MSFETPERNIWWESRVVLDVSLLAFRLRELVRTAPRPDRPYGVICYPGFAAGDWSTWVLRRYLIALGYDARGWGRGNNPGKVESILPELVRDAETLTRQTGGPIHVVGWSHGGILARQVARARPDLVDSIVTMGTPVVGGPKYTAVAHRFEEMGTDLDELERKIANQESSRPLEAPVTAIFSRRDGVVFWEACIDEWSRAVEHVEVESSHSGLGFHPDVLLEVARRLAAPVRGGLSSTNRR